MCIPRSFMKVLALPLFFVLGFAASCDGEDPDDMQTCAADGELSDVAEDGCCEGLLVDFTNTCRPCVPLDEMRSVDGPGCCEGLVTVGEDLTCVEL